MPKLKLYANNTSLDSGHVHRILAFGDSLTEGSLRKGMKFHPYTTQLEMKLNDEFNYTRFQVLNEGVSGETAYVSMATRLPKLLERMSWLRLDLVIILGGTNDLRKLDCSKYVNVAYEIIALHKLVHNKGIYTLLCTIPENAELGESCEENRKKVNDKLKNYARDHENQTLFLDLSTEFPLKNLTAEERGMYWDDNIHPSRLGYEKMADLIFRTIRKMYHVGGVTETRKNDDDSDYFFTTTEPPTSLSPVWESSEKPSSTEEPLTTPASFTESAEKNSLRTTQRASTIFAPFSGHFGANFMITTEKPTKSSVRSSTTNRPTEDLAEFMGTDSPQTTPFWPEMAGDS